MDQTHKERARAFFAGLAERHGLSIKWGEELPVGLCCTYPAQDGLDFELALDFWEDELTLTHQWFWVDRFPTADPDVWSDFERFADGLITGEAHALIHHCGDPKRPYLTQAMICEGEEWRSVSSGLAPWRWRPWGRKTEVVRNTGGRI